MEGKEGFLSFLPRAPKFPLPLPLLTPATQARKRVAPGDVYTRSRLIIRSLSEGVFVRRTLTISEAFFLLICFDATKFVFLSFFTIITTICPKIWAKTLPKNVKSPIPVDVRRSKTSCSLIFGGRNARRNGKKINCEVSIQTIAFFRANRVRGDGF